jgi:iron complex transport system substrate-binding protein
MSLLLMGIAPSVSLFAAETRIVRDQAGRSVRVPANPRRVVALAPSVTEIVFALKQESRLVGATQFSDYPPEADRLPKVGSYIRLDLEKITALGPDLCIAVKDGNPVDVVSRLEMLNIPVYAVDPRSLDTVMAAILSIGDLLNAAEAASSMVADMKGRVSRIRQLASGAKERPGVFFQIGVSPIVSVGTPTFLHELIESAGGRNLAAGDTPYPRFSREQVLALAPEILIITSMARGELFQKVKEEWMGWRELPAVRNRRVHILDSDVLDRPGPRMADGLAQLFDIIHPDLAGKY